MKELFEYWGGEKGTTKKRRIAKVEIETKTKDRGAKYFNCAPKENNFNKKKEDIMGKGSQHFRREQEAGGKVGGSYLECGKYYLNKKRLGKSVSSKMDGNTEEKKKSNPDERRGGKLNRNTPQ